MRILYRLAPWTAILLFVAADAPDSASKPAAPAAAPAAATPGTAATPAAGTPPAEAEKPKLKIIPGKVIVPGDTQMRRPWGELVSIDLAKRTGTFRNESTDQIQSFIVMPYSELTHHAAPGDLQDYRVGERAIFRLHPNDDGQWVWLTYIQDEMNFLNGHREYYYVDKIDPTAGKIEVTDANFDKSFVRGGGIILETDGDTHYWRADEPAAFSDIKVGDKLRTKTHGVGQGKTRRCWEVFLDDASLVKFQEAQRQVNRERMKTEGLPGYVDEAQPEHLQLTLFCDGQEFFPKLKPGVKVRVAPAGVDRKATGEATAGVVEAAKPSGRTAAVSLKLEQPAGGSFQPAGLARMWIE